MDRKPEKWMIEDDVAITVSYECPRCWDSKETGVSMDDLIMNLETFGWENVADEDGDEAVSCPGCVEGLT